MYQFDEMKKKIDLLRFILTFWYLDQNSIYRRS